MLDGWISLHRKIINWEWYSDDITFRVFIHLLLTANHEDNSWKGIEIHRGQTFTSYQHIIDEIGNKKLTIKKIRTAINHLKTTGEVTVKATYSGLLVTITNYEDYQCAQSKRADNMAEDTTSNRQTKGRLRATNNNDNNIIIFINKYKGAPENFNESMKIMRKARADSEWNTFTSEQQMVIQNYLMKQVH